MRAPDQFVLGRKLCVAETRHIEFKEVISKNPLSVISNAADEYAVAFLNSEGGSIYWGVRDADKVVVGVELSEDERDRLSQVVTSKLSEIQPQIDPSRFKLKLHSVIKGGPNRFVVELTVPKVDSSKPFFTAGHDCFVRLDGVKKKLSGQQLTDLILSRVTNQITSLKNGAIDAQLLKLAQRIRHIFSSHGLQPGHLARFFTARKAPFTITLAEQQNDTSFLRWLDEPKIAWIAQTFGLRREWIDGEDERIFEEQFYDKRPEKFFSDISRHADALIYEDTPALPEAWFLRFGVGKDWSRRGQNGVFVVIRVPLACLSNETTVFRYLSDFEPYDWAEGRTAVQLRAWARLLDINKRMHCVGREVSYDIGQAIWGNTAFLHEVLESPNIAQRCRDDWHPEDYALYPEESVAAKPDVFFPHVIEFLKGHSLPYESSGSHTKR